MRKESELWKDRTEPWIAKIERLSAEIKKDIKTTGQTSNKLNAANAALRDLNVKLDETYEQFDKDALKNQYYKMLEDHIVLSGMDQHGDLLVPALKAFLDKMSITEQAWDQQEEVDTLEHQRDQMRTQLNTKREAQAEVQEEYDTFMADKKSIGSGVKPRRGIRRPAVGRSARIVKRARSLSNAAVVLAGMTSAEPAEAASSGGFSFGEEAATQDYEDSKCTHTQLH